MIAAAISAKRTPLVLLLWTMAIALSPISLLGPGKPQVMHGLLAIGLFGAWWYGPRERTLLLIGGFWLLDVFVVNASWWMLIDRADSKFMMTSVFYAFNFAVLVGTASVIARGGDQARQWLRVALLIALALEIAAIVLGINAVARFDPETGEPISARTAGTFDNPNQLGYWSLLIASCWFALHDDEKLTLGDGLVTAAAVFLCLQSGSRAAAVGAAALLVIAFCRYGIRMKVIPVAFVLAMAGGVAAAGTSSLWLDRLTEQPMVQRFGQEKEHDSFAGRGYDRIWLYPQYLLFGAGEGYEERFERLSQGGDNEIHSTFATILFSYGLLGSALFLAMMWRVLRWSGWTGLILCLPLAFYGAAHQGLRFTPLWLFLGVLLSERWARR